MISEIVLWGKRIGAEDWEEELITSAPNTSEGQSKLKKAEAWAKSNGFDRFRVSKFNPSEPPDFTKVF